MTGDPYLDPATGALRNLLGICDGDLLRIVEADVSAAVMLRLLEQPVPGSFDLRHLCLLHREIFRKVYPWAGEIRTVAIAKSDLFCLPQHIEPYAAEVFGQLADAKHLAGLPRSQFVERLTHFYAEVNALHPFREGNGRTQRAFFSQLARQAGWPIDWTGLDQQRNIETSVASLRGNLDPLQSMLDELVER